MNKSKIIFNTILILLTALIFGCDLEEPAAPSWDVTANIPFTNKNYNVFDIIKKSGNLGADSGNNNQIFLLGESDFTKPFGATIVTGEGHLESFLAPAAFQFDTAVSFDDSTVVRDISFLGGQMTFKFFNQSQQSYTVDLIVKNLLRNNSNDTARVNAINVQPGIPREININLAEFHMTNETATNKIKLKLVYAVPAEVNFNYSVSPFAIKTVRGFLKPVNTGSREIVIDNPYGSDVPEGQIQLGSIASDKNAIIVKRYTTLFQVDFLNVSIVGINKNGNRVRFRYWKNGNPGDAVDSVFRLCLPSNKESVAYNITTANSNILEFLNNIPQKIIMQRTDFLNLPYAEGTAAYQDSVTLDFNVNIPLDFSITKPITFRDTMDVGISDSEQREKMDFTKGVNFNLKVNNGLPLLASAKMLICDSSFNTLIAITSIMGNQPDSSLSLSAATVGYDGFVNAPAQSNYNISLDSLQITKLKRMGKIIYEYNFLTDANHIPSPGTTVKIRGNDLIRVMSFGSVGYRIEN